MMSAQKRIIDYQGTSRKIPQNYQKLVDRKSKQEVFESKTIPQSIKEVSANPDEAIKKTKID